VGDDCGGSELVDRRERAARRFDADVDLGHELARLRARPLALTFRRIAAEPQQEFGLDGREAALEDGKAHDLPGAGLADAAREDRACEAIVLEHRRRLLADEADLPAGDRVLNELDGGVLARVSCSEVGRQRAREAGQCRARLARRDEALRNRLRLGAEGASAGLFEHQEPFPSMSVDAGQGMGNRCHYQYTGLPTTWAET